MNVCKLVNMNTVLEKKRVLISNKPKDWKLKGPSVQVTYPADYLQVIEA